MPVEGADKPPKVSPAIVVLEIQSLDQFLDRYSMVSRDISKDALQSAELDWTMVRHDLVVFAVLLCGNPQM